MKRASLFLLLMTFAGLPAFASPYALRPLPSGYKAKVVENVGQYYSSAPVVVDLGIGYRVWYGGGSNFSSFPYTPNPLGGEFTLSLPALAMAGFPSVTESPQAGVPCDVDRDGDMDIIRINSWNGWDTRDTLQVFLNQGGGTFTAGYRLDMDIPAFPDSHARHYHIDSADIDRDGDPDVAILMAPDDVNRSTNPWRYQGTLTIRWNDGTGSFPASTVLQSSGFRENAAMAIGDVDNDGDIDILCDGHGTVSGGVETIISIIYKNSGTGTFAIFNEGASRPARYADLNRDGWLDVGFGRFTALNNKTGAIADISLAANFTGSAIRDYLYADADSDGILDLVINDGSNLVYRKGDGTGQFQQTAITMVSLPSPAAAIGAGDSDNDGDTDFLLHLNNGTFAFLENRSLHQAAGGSLAGGIASSVSVPGVTQLHAADFDRDGLDDLLAVAPAQRKLWVMFGEEDGIPSAPVLFRNTAAEPHSAAVADFDRDGRTDVAYTLPGAGEVRMARNTGGLLITWPDSAIASGLSGVAFLRTGELGTPNGRADLLTGNISTGQIRWLYQSGSSWNSQTVYNSFAPVPGCIMTSNATNRPGDEVFLLAADTSTMFLRGFQLNPTWVTLGTNLATPVSTAPLATIMAWADVTGDSRKEVVFAKGDGALGFWNPLTATGGSIGAATSDIRAITPVDWDRDGRTDILCATGAGVCLFTWKGSWTREQLLQSGSYTSVAAIDLNRDSWMDAAVGDAATGFVYLLTNFPRALAARHTSPAQVTLITGQTGPAATFEATSVGEPADSSLNSLADVNAVVNSTDVYFYRAVSSGDTWTKGTALTPGELTQAVSSLALVSGNTIIGTGSPSSAAGGGVSVKYAAGAGTLAPIAPGSTQALSVRLTLTAGASQSAFSRFFVELRSTISGYPQDGISTGRLIPVSGIQPVLVTITPVLTPLQQWRQNNFGTWEDTGSAANDADPDGDGNSNLLEYVKNSNPNSTIGISEGPAFTITGQGFNAALLANLVLLNTYDSKVRLTLQSSTNLTSWTTLSTRTGTGAWTGVQPAATSLSGGRTRFTFNTGAIPSATARYFVRLTAAELP